MARNQLTGWKKRLDDWFAGGAEQNTIAREQKSGQQQFIRDYNGEFEIVANDNSYVGRCACGCGRTVACNFGIIYDESTKKEYRIAEACAQGKVAERGLDTDYLPWNQWRLPAHKRPVKLG